MLQACIAEKAKYDLTDLTDREFERIVFADAGTRELRGISDAFTAAEVQTILESDLFVLWSDYNQDWLRTWYLENA